MYGIRKIDIKRFVWCAFYFCSKIQQLRKRVTADVSDASKSM